MTWGELRAESEAALADAGRERPARLTLNWFDDVFGRASRRSTEVVPQANLSQARGQLDRLVAGEPLAYVTGIAHFYGYELEVGPGVLIPRPETEELVRWILEREADSPLIFADLCTGSGCIAVALALRRLRWRGLPVDISEHALRVARANVRKHDLADHLQILGGDVLDPGNLLGEQELDIIVSNPPYIPIEDWDRVEGAVAAYEPHLALRVPSSDPLQFYRRLGDVGLRRLRVGGRLYVECNDRFVAEVAELLDDYGFMDVEVFVDMQGKSRHVCAVKP